MNIGGPPPPALINAPMSVVARGYQAIERRDEPLILFKHAQAIEIRLRRANEPLFVRGIGGALIEILLRDGVGFDQRLAARQRHIR